MLDFVYGASLAAFQALLSMLAATTLFGLIGMTGGWIADRTTISKLYGDRN